jgi:uncharacterized phage protein gp47/JayE
MEYGLTAKGFVVKPFHVILKEEQDAFQTAFGTDIDLSDESIEGVYIKNQSLKLSQLWELLGKLYATGDVDDAFGVYLDRLVNFVNVQRLSANATQVYECLWAEEGTEIPSSHLLKLRTGEMFKIYQAVTISPNSLLGFSFKIKDIEVGHQYQFQINTSTISYTAQNGDDEEIIQTGLLTELKTAFPEIFDGVNNGADGIEIYSVMGNQPFLFACTDSKIEQLLLGGFAVYNAVVKGPTFVPIQSLTEIVTKIDGLESAINYASGITGRNAESDAEVRLNLGVRQRQATASEIAIQNEILKVSGVEYARVYSNREIIEVAGRPPKSFEAVVVGGDEQAIADIIFEKGPAGIQAFGNIVKDVVDSEGFHWDIGFSRPINKYIWIKVDYSRNSEEDLPLDAVNAIQENIIAWSLTALNVGVDLIYQKMFRPVYDVRGIGFAAIKVAATTDLTPPAVDDYQSGNVEIGEVEIAIIDKTRIAVQELP